jgi:small subunit ribosomal protein S17
MIYLYKLLSLDVCFRDETGEASKLPEESDSQFKYEKAPKRGWQEGKKDFTHRETYIKYHVFENGDQPYAV